MRNLMMNAIRYFSNWSIQFIALVVVVLLLYQQQGLTYALASKVRGGMTEQQVEALLGKPISTEHFAHAVIDHPGKVLEHTEIVFMPMQQQGPGLPTHSLRVMIPESTSAYQLLISDGFAVWISDEWSVIVIYDSSRCVKEAYLCPTTVVTPGNVWERIKWRITQWLH